MHKDELVHERSKLEDRMEGQKREQEELNELGREIEDVKRRIMEERNLVMDENERYKRL